jgi:hypothetical protein
MDSKIPAKGIIDQSGRIEPILLWSILVAAVPAKAIDGRINNKIIVSEILPGRFQYPLKIFKRKVLFAKRILLQLFNFRELPAQAN